MRAKRAAKGWQGIQLLEVLQGWWGYLQYGLPCVLMVCLEVRQGAVLHCAYVCALSNCQTLIKSALL